MLTDQKCALGEQVRKLISIYEDTTGEMSQIQTMLREALSSIGSLTKEKRSLSLQVKEFVETSNADRAELARTGDILKNALASVTSLASDKRTLSEQLIHLVEVYDAAKDELNIIRKNLRVGAVPMGIQTTGRKVSEQVIEVIANFDAAREHERMSQKALEKAQRLQRAAEASEAQAIDERKLIQQASIHERSRLVTAALTAMQDLREHVTHTASGLRVTKPGKELDEEFAFLSWHSWDDATRWGTTSAKAGKVNVRLQSQPELPQLDAQMLAVPAPKQPSAPPSVQVPSSPRIGWDGLPVPPAPAPLQLPQTPHAKPSPPNESGGISPRLMRLRKIHAAELGLEVSPRRVDLSHRVTGARGTAWDPNAPGAPRAENDGFDDYCDPPHPDRRRCQTAPAST